MLLVANINAYHWGMGVFGEFQVQNPQMNPFMLKQPKNA